jgi:hypothetical protein
MWFQRLVEIDESKPEPIPVRNERAVAVPQGSVRAKGPQVHISTPADFQRVRLMRTLRLSEQRENNERYTQVDVILKENLSGHAGTSANTVPGIDAYSIKCICEQPEDDGYTVYCETCDSWQHIECFYPGRTEEVSSPEFSHFCADCKPRPLARWRAIEWQRARIGLNGVRKPVPIPQAATVLRAVKGEPAPPEQFHRERDYGDSSFESYIEAFVDDDNDADAWSSEDDNVDISEDFTPPGPSIDPGRKSIWTPIRMYSALNQLRERHGDMSFQGYGEGSVDDDLQDTGSFTGDDDDKAGGWKRPKKVWNLLHHTNVMGNKTERTRQLRISKVQPAKAAAMALVWLELERRGELVWKRHE